MTGALDAVRMPHQGRGRRDSASQMDSPQQVLNSQCSGACKFQENPWISCTVTDQVSILFDASTPACKAAYSSFTAGRKVGVTIKNYARGALDFEWEAVFGKIPFVHMLSVFGGITQSCAERMTAANPGLDGLIISDCDPDMIDVCSGHSLSSVPQGLVNLTSLDLSYNQITQLQSRSLFESLHSLRAP
jgi:hypothetical protein